MAGPSLVPGRAGVIPWLATPSSGAAIDRESLIRQASLFVIAALVAALLSYALLIRKPPPIRGDVMSPVHPRFDAARADANLRALLKACPSRVTGSAGARCAADFIEKRFEEDGLSTRRQVFSMWLRGKRVEGINVIAAVRGTSTRTLALLAHFDAPATGRDAASDNATGVATLLELAHVFASEKPPRSILFVATDAGAWGSIGADMFAREKVWRHFGAIGASPPYAALSLDRLGPGPASGIALDGGGQFHGFTPIWLRARVAYAIASRGMRVFPQEPFSQIVARALPLSFADQGPLLDRGIPAINLSTRPLSGSGAPPLDTTARIRPEEIRPGALVLYGTAAEVAARAVLDTGVTASPDVITLSPTKILGRDASRWMAALLFLPLAVLALDGINRLRRAPRGAVITVARAAAWALPPVLAAIALRLAVRLDLLPAFSHYPARIGDPFLTAWAPLPMAAALGAALLGAAAAAVLAPRRAAPARDAGLLLLLAAALWAWSWNDLAAALFLAPAAWCWPWIGAGRARRRWLDAVLLLLGLAPLAALAVVAAKRLCLGPWVLWYGALLEAYGTVGLRAAGIIGLAVAAAVAMGRAAPPPGNA